MLGSSQRQQLATIMIARNYQWLIDTNDFAMASITIRHLSAESKERLRKRAESSGCSLEALARSILDAAARAPVPPTGFPHDLIALVDPSEDIESYVQEHDQPQVVVEL